MKRETTTMPASLRKAIREKRDAANAAAKSYVSQNREGYEKYVRTLEDPNAIGVSGMYDFFVVIGRCLPKEWYEFYDKQLDAYFENDEQWTRLVIQYLRTEDGRAAFERHGCFMHGTPLEVYLQLAGHTKEQHKAGMMSYLQYIIFINGNFNTEYVVNLMDTVLKGDDTMATYTYYYLAIDNGYQKIVNQLSSIWMTKEHRHKTGGLFNLIVPSLVETSTSVGATDKSSWREFADKSDDDDLYREVNGSLRHVEDNRGTKKDFTALTDMLVNDKQGEVLLGIESFLNENKETVSLAYLLHSLERAKRIKCKSFGLFREAVNQHFGMDIPYRKAQERYSEIRDEPHCLVDKDRKAMVKARRIIEEWTEVFRNCA